MARWRAAHPGYAKAWREAHADSERARRQQYRAAHREVMRAQYARRSERRRDSLTPIPEPYTGHPLFESARAVLAAIGLREHGGMRVWSDPTWHDVMGATVIALLEGLDPEAAARSSWAAERRFKMTHLEMYFE